MIERNRASEFIPPETPSVFFPVHRNGDYSISKSVFGKHSRICIICDTNFRLFEIHPDFEICTLRNSNFASCAKISVSKITRYTVPRVHYGLLILPYQIGLLISLMVHPPCYLSQNFLFTITCFQQRIEVPSYEILLQTGGLMNLR